MPDFTSNPSAPDQPSYLPPTNHEQESADFQFLEQLPIALIVYEGSAFIIAHVNKTALEIWGKDKQDLIGKSVWDVSPEMKESGAYRAALQVLDTGVPFEASLAAIDRHAWRYCCQCRCGNSDFYRTHLLSGRYVHSKR